MKTYTVEEVRSQLDEIVGLALGGEPIAIVKDSETLVLQKSLFSEPIPEHPPGYFDDIYDEDYVRECNEMAKHSVISIPRDLE